MKLRSLRSFVPALILGTTLAVSALAHSPRPDAAKVALVEARFGATAEVRWDMSGTVPKRLSNISVATEGKDAHERALSFVRGSRDLFGLGADQDVEVLEVRALSKTKTVVHVRPTWKGLPIEGRTLAVSLDKNDRVTSVTSDLGPLDIPVNAIDISAEAAQDAVKSHFSVASVGAPTKVVLANGTAGRVAWKVPAVVIPLSAHFDVWVDAADASIMKQAPASPDQAMKKLPLRK